MQLLLQNVRIRYIIIFTIALICAALISIRVGTISFALREVVVSLIKCSDNALAEQVIYNIRLPRTIIAGLVGCNLAVAGALLQGVLRNPLASPQIIGVNSGAGLGAVAIMILLPNHPALVPPTAFLGAMLAALTVYFLARSERVSTEVTIVLAGVAISAMLSAFTSGLMTIYSDSLEVTYAWLLGGLSGRSWTYFQQIWPYTVFGFMAALYLSPKMNLFLLGDEVGRSLGLSIESHRVIILLCAALLAGSAVAVAGTIGFVGLVAPHTARLMVGNDYRYLTAFSAILGALLLISADMVARIAFQPMELPVGIITSLIGAPFFIYLLLRKKNQ
jgi:iron complex transport system permease protein